MRNRVKACGLTLVVAALFTLLHVPVVAASQVTYDGPPVARFEGTTITPAHGWGDATGCMVWASAGVVECFRTVAAMEARAAEVHQGMTPGSMSVMSASASCSYPLKLFEHNGYGGRQLWFYDRGYWQNLTDWGFNDQLSSYQIGACYVYLAEHIWGGGSWYPGNTNPWTWSSSMVWGWNDRVSSLYIT